MKKYIPAEIEAKIQGKWVKEELYKTDLTKPKKFYVLAEYAYPSGNLHMGHWFTFAGADIYARFKRLQGFNVFFPNGFDAFGLPAENAAIKNKIHPEDWTLANVEKMKEQFGTMGASFTFDHEVITCLPEYYKWNQWIFLQMLKKDLAYQKKSLSNWCEQCQTVLANEGVEAGACWRCGTEVVQKEVEQWFFKITDYAEKLLWKETPSVDWPQSLRDAQNNWIGKSEGALIKFNDLEVFTTRPDTIFGATFLVLSPEHPKLKDLISKQQEDEVLKYIQIAGTKSELERKENKEKTGVFTGSYVKNPLSEKDIPVWVADYVLTGYGTGAIMAVPAHDERDFEFAKKFGLEIVRVVKTDEDESEKEEKATTGEGIMVNSGQYNGLSSSEAREKITNYLVEHHLGSIKVQYHLHDWSISRQRYWGTPIPIIYCPDCGVVPVPEEDLPVKLPRDVDYTPKGKSPLASNEEWINVKCPKCKGEAKRDADTMDTFVDSSWYFFRYLSPDLENKVFDIDLAKKIMPVNTYFGGAEHNLGHTLYSRFFTKFFKDLGLTDLDEYAQRRVNHGIVLGPDGNKMSKSKGNVVNPDEEVKKYGADAVRIHVAFFMPYEGSSGPWISERIWGPFRFLERVWNLFDKVSDIEPTKQDLIMLNKIVKKTGEDIDGIRFNTAVAALMEWLNYLSHKEKVSQYEYKTLLILLAPFAPHITEELWELLGQEGSIHNQPWPQIEEKYLQDEKITIVVQVDGKVRDNLLIESDLVNSQPDIEKLALNSPRVQKCIDSVTVVKVIYVPGKIINLVTTKN
ncbi:MAG: leucine--tRNA ligase [Candidatus Daviesbacteria bacterium]|nr:leucine--tRNA ligase [Candidatus Daviesbacteria bacterium]